MLEFVKLFVEVFDEFEVINESALTACWMPER